MISKITTLLVILYMYSTNFSYGEFQMRSISEENDSELEREVQRLNKTPKKTFQLENGQIIDCIDIDKQPSLDHPLLKNHVVQRKPLSYPKEIKKLFAKAKPLPKESRRKSCPHGTVPIKRTTKDDLLMARKFSNDFHKAHSNVDATAPPTNHVVNVNTKNTQTYHGVSGYFSMYNISVTKDQASATNVWVTNTIYNEVVYMAAGSMVSQSFNNDSNHHLFVYWTTQVKDFRDGCFNTYCPGFVQFDTKYHPGSFLTTGNNYNVNRYPLDEIPIMIFQEEISGHWWVMLSNQLKFVGYWPKDLVDIDGAANVGWGAFTNPGTTGVNPPMGSGHKPDHVYNHAAYFRDMKYLKKELKPQIPADSELYTYLDPCYAIDDLHYSGSPYWGYDFFFGGPGGRCGN